MKKDIIRVGDRVRIITPDFFVRCGYDVCLKSEREKLWQEYPDKMNELINLVRSLIPAEIYAINIVHDEQCERKIINALAYAKLSRCKKDGSERKIFTVNIPEQKDKVFQIPPDGIKFCKTGNYSAGYSTGWYGEQDYEPPYLCDDKTHKLLKCNYVYIPNEKTETDTVWDNSPTEYVEWIEAKNVEKVVE